MDGFDVEQFIYAIEERGVIWDKYHSDFKDRLKTKAAWDEICTTFIKGYENMSMKEKVENARTLKSKWQNLRDSWMKSYKKWNRQSSYNKRVKKYVFHDQLSFLEDNIERSGAEHEARMSSDLESDDNMVMMEVPVEPTLEKSNLFKLEPTAYDEETNSSSPSRNKVNKESTKHRIDSPSESVLLEIIKRLPSVEKNEDRSFFESILPAVNTFDEDQRMEFRLEVLQLIKRIKRREH